MRRLILSACLGLAAFLAAGMAGAAERKATLAGLAPAAGEETTCGKHGTTIAFVDTPAEAARQAKKEAKLVFVLHVSGDFEDPRFT